MRLKAIVQCRQNPVSYIAMNMNQGNNEQLGEGVVYKDIVPLCWRDIAREELEFSYLSLQDANEEVLRFITTLDECYIEGADEAGGASASDLSRIEFKLNLLLDMVTQLVERETSMPESAPITLGSSGIEWSSATPPREGALLEVSLYLHHKYPRPFIVIGQVLTIKALEGKSGKYLIHLAFDTMSAAVQSALEKLIFRQHRRSIAQSRRTSLAED